MGLVLKRRMVKSMLMKRDLSVIFGLIMKRAGIEAILMKRDLSVVVGLDFD